MNQEVEETRRLRRRRAQCWHHRSMVGVGIGSRLGVRNSTLDLVAFSNCMVCPGAGQCNLPEGWDNSLKTSRIGGRLSSTDDELGLVLREIGIAAWVQATHVTL